MTTRLIHFVTSALILAGLCGISKAAQPRAIVVSAGGHDRQHTPVSFKLADAVAAGNYLLVDDGGAATPIQVDVAHHATFILHDLKAGKTRAYRIAPLPETAPAGSNVRAEKADGHVTITVGGKEVIVYQGEKTPLPPAFEPEYQRGGYIHPVYTPSGTLVTDDYAPDHKHHHGIWSPWTDTQFEGRTPDFWNMGKKTGTVEFVSLDETWSGPVFAGFRTKHRFMDLSAKPVPKAALNETWDVNVYDIGNEKIQGSYRLFDWQSTQTTAGESPLILPKYHYGGLGFRGHRTWTGPDGIQFLTSEGKDRKTGDDTRAKWVRCSGKVDGKDVSCTVLGHPDDFRFPQPGRLNPKQPFFCFAPESLGEFKIEPGKPYVAKYRFIVADGLPDKETIERLWSDYAEPPAVEVN